MVSLPAKLCAIHVICIYFNQSSIANVKKTELASLHFAPHLVGTVMQARDVMQTSKIAVAITRYFSGVYCMSFTPGLYHVIKWWNVHNLSQCIE